MINANVSRGVDLELEGTVNEIQGELVTILHEVCYVLSKKTDIPFEMVLATVSKVANSEVAMQAFLAYHQLKEELCDKEDC